MVAYSFQKRFEAPILADEKLQTIRAPRKRHARFGEELQLYVGMRTKHCRLIARRRALSVHNVVIDIARQTVLVGETFPACRVGDGFDYQWEGQSTRLAEVLDRDAFAVRDGFGAWADMHAFWIEQHGASGAEGELSAFHGVVIRWVPARNAPIDGEASSPISREIEELGL